MTSTQPTLVPVIVEPDFDSFAVRQAIAESRGVGSDQLGYPPRKDLQELATCSVAARIVRCC
jgi:hypothetical protein